LTKGKAGSIISIVFNEAVVGSTWKIISYNGEGKALWKNSGRVRPWLKQRAMGSMECRSIGLKSGHKETMKLLKGTKFTGQHTRNGMVRMRKTQ